MSSTMADAIRLLGDPELGRLLEQHGQAGEADVCNVAFLGEFNRGKSSLVNLLLGAALLPVDVRPTTARVVSLRRGAPPRATLVHHDGRETVVALDAEVLRRVQTEESGGERADDVRLVHIEHPDVPDGFRFFDTPGVNDLGETDPALVYELVPFVDVAVFVLDASAGVSRSEQSFLAERLLSNARPALLFLANKSDRLVVADDEEREDVRVGIRGGLEQVAGKGVELLFTESSAPYFTQTREAILTALRAAAGPSIALRSQRLRTMTATRLDARLGQLEAETLVAGEQARAELARLEQGVDGLRRAFDAFRRHVSDEGRLPLLKMVDRSLSGLQERGAADLDRRIALSGPLAAYAQHGLAADVAAVLHAWADRHVPEVQAFLGRHRQFVAIEFQRTFGHAFPIHRAEPIMCALARVETAEVDASSFEDSERAMTWLRFGLPAAGSVVLGLIAAPIAPFGLFAGFVIADAHRRQSEERLRAELQAAGRALLESSVENVRRDLSQRVDGHFKRLDALLLQAFEERVSTARAVLTSAAQAAGSAEQDRRERRGLLVDARRSLAEA